MAGDPINAALWTDADVLVAPLGSPIPANAAAAFSGAWTRVGLLDGDAGADHNRSVNKDDKFAWGQILVRTSRKNFKLELGFTMLEYNDATRSIIWPGSSATRLKVPTPTPILLALELREGNRTRRLITALHAECDVDSYNESENDLAKFPVKASIFPNGDKELWIPQDTLDNPPTALVITGTATVAETEITKLIATATLTDLTTVDVSASAVWTSSAPTKATVAFGYVTGVEAGSSTIGASWGGVSDTESVTVTS